MVKKVQYVAIDRGEKTRELNTLVYFAGGGLSLLHVLLLKLEDSHTHTHKHTNTHAHTHMRTRDTPGLVGKTFSTRRQGASITASEFVAGENTRQLYARKCDQQVMLQMYWPCFQTASLQLACF